MLLLLLLLCVPTAVLTVIQQLPSVENQQNEFVCRRSASQLTTNSADTLYIMKHIFLYFQTMFIHPAAEGCFIRFNQRVLHSDTAHAAVFSKSAAIQMFSLPDEGHAVAN